MDSHDIQIRVRYNECDPMGVAHHGAYPAWFEMGRTELLRAQGGSYADMEAGGVLLAVVKLEIRYKAPARYDDVLTLTTTCTKVSHVKIEHAYELRRDDLVLTTARTTLACLNRDGQPQMLPESLRGS